jgi:SAM-dependent methyltransferase
MVSLAQAAFSLVCRQDLKQPEDYRERDWPRSFASAEEFLRRLGGSLNVEGKRVLDVGCGTGALAAVLARRGATEVVGVDINPDLIDFGTRAIEEDASDVADRVRLQVIDRLTDIGQQRFDVVVSKDSFEHFADPEGFVAEVGNHLSHNGGELVIGFGPLWKSPYGGHLEHMTRLPWAHLIFPERVIMLERRNFSLGPWDGAMRFEDITGGLNRMTYGRFVRILRENGYTPSYLALNRKEGSRLGAAMSSLRRIPALREYMTFNVYSVWQRGRGGSDRVPDPREALSLSR